MARITVEDCLVRENNRFSLVQLCSKRTKQLFTGAPLTIAQKKNKPVVSALREIAAGNVRFMTGDEQEAFEAQKAQEVEAARAAEVAEREKRVEIGAGLFSNGSDTRSSDFLREALTKTGPVAKGDADDSDEE
jgi:DNA-directed RNA polymerase subunit omega